MNKDMQNIEYTALIRTYNSAPLVFDVIEKLKKQTVPPAYIMAVDSGTSNEALHELSSKVDQLVDISDNEFNFSRAINLGIAQCKTKYVLIISSHVLLNSPHVIENLLTSLQQNECEVGCISWDPVADNKWVVRVVTPSNFNGENALNNSCSFMPVEYAKELPFREEVFSAEDQEWSVRYFKRYRKPIVAVHSSHVAYLNARFNYTKKLNEEIALAYYVDPSRRSLKNVGLWLLKVMWSIGRRDFPKALFRLKVAFQLILMRLRPPHKSSRYF